jgi:tRNA(Ile)-lysidine synthase
MYTRNKARHDLLPQLAREYNPRIIDVLSDLAVTASEDYAFLAARAQKEFDKTVVISKAAVKADLKKTSRMHPAIRRLVFRLMAEKLCGDPAVLEFEHIHALEILAAPAGRGRVDLSCGLRAVKTSQFLEIFYA